MEIDQERVIQDSEGSENTELAAIDAENNVNTPETDPQTEDAAGGSFTCRKCGAELTSETDYCPKCGTPVKRICPKCGCYLSDDQDYCPKCGTRFPGPEGTTQTDSLTKARPAKGGFNKKPVIFGALLILALIVGLVVYKTVSRPNLEKLVRGYLEDNPAAVGFLSGNDASLGGDSTSLLKPCIKLGGDGTWVKVDSNPNDLDWDDFDEGTRYERAYYNAVHPLIDYLNEKLGFDVELLKENMGATSALMGVQTVENKICTITWSYHPDKGLEVTYTLKGRG